MPLIGFGIGFDAVIGGSRTPLHPSSWAVLGAFPDVPSTSTDQFSVNVCRSAHSYRPHLCIDAGSCVALRKSARAAVKAELVMSLELALRELPVAAK
jgi:hypothetical protein